MAKDTRNYAKPTSNRKQDKEVDGDSFRMDVYYPGTNEGAQADYEAGRYTNYKKTNRNSPAPVKHGKDRMFK